MHRTATAAAVALTSLLVAGCGSPAGQHRGDGAQPITARAVAAQALDHVGAGRLPAARGQDTKPTRSGLQELHMAVWPIAAGRDLVVAVAANDRREFDGTCASVKQDPSTRSCREDTVGKTKVVTFSSGQDMTGGRLPHGVTWGSIVYPSRSEAVTAVLVLQRATAAQKAGSSLPVSLAQLRAIVADPDLRLRTSKAVIAHGRELSDFRAVG